MFGMFIALFFSLVIEILLIVFTTPYINSDQIKHAVVILFALNTGALFGILSSLILIFLYIRFQAYQQLKNKSFIRRGVLFGSGIFLLILSKVYGVLDIFVLIFLSIIIFVIDFILAKK